MSTKSQDKTTFNTRDLFSEHQESDTLLSRGSIRSTSPLDDSDRSSSEKNEIEGSEFFHPQLNEILHGISPLEWLKFLLFAFALMIAAVANLADSSIVFAMTSKRLGTESLDAISVTVTPLLIFAYIFQVLTYGITSRIGTLKGIQMREEKLASKVVNVDRTSEDTQAKNINPEEESILSPPQPMHHISDEATTSILQDLTPTDEIARRINIGLVCAAGYGLLISIVFFFGQDLVFQIYGITGLERELASRYLSVRCWNVPFTVLAGTCYSIFQGLQNITIQFIFVLLQNVLNAFFNYLVLYVFNLTDLRASAAASMLSNVLVCLALLIIIYTKYNKEYGFFRPVARQWDRTIVQGFFTDSTWLSFKGLFLIGFYQANSILASRIGSSTLASYTILSTLSLYSTYLSDALGTVTNLVGSKFIGAGNFRAAKLFFNVMPFVGLFLLGIPVSLVYFFAENTLIDSFTKDSAVSGLLHRAWLILVITQPITGAVGVYEGVLYSVHHFKSLFIIQAIDTLCVYLPLTFVVVDYFPNIQSLMMLDQIFMIVRILPLPLYIHYFITVKILPKMEKQNVVHTLEKN